MPGIKKITLVLSMNDPEQNELYRFVNFLPNGQKRNSSAFLRMLVENFKECKIFVQPESKNFE